MIKIRYVVQSVIHLSLKNLSKWVLFPSTCICSLMFVKAAAVQQSAMLLSDAGRLQTGRAGLYYYTQTWFSNLLNFVCFCWEKLGLTDKDKGNDTFYILFNECSWLKKNHELWKHEKILNCNCFHHWILICIMCSCKS